MGTFGRGVLLEQDTPEERPVAVTPQLVRRLRLRAGHPSVGQPCPACQEPFDGGDHVTLVVLGPGGDARARERARMGRPYPAVGVLVHWACVTGEDG